MTFNNSNWDESKHPRDDIGRFTFKNRVVGLGLDEEPILKGKIEHNENTNEEKNSKSNSNNNNSKWDIFKDKLKDRLSEINYRDILLTVLHGITTPAQILYSNISQLNISL